ncbi:MAG: leucine-rich repeat domain-containing protein [Paludibacter sp.]
MKTTLPFLFLIISVLATAQVTKTVNVSNQGTLSSLAKDFLSTVTNLTVKGNIDARDVKCMRDQMPMLVELDISAVSIQAYTGIGGTYNDIYETAYPANEMPQYSFWTTIAGTGITKNTLKNITLPITINSIGNYAFQEGSGITNLSLPSGVTNIGQNAFNGCSAISGTLNLPNSITSIGSLAFCGCSAITGTLILPNSIVYLGDGAFAGCSNITGSLTIPSTLSSIGIYTFSITSINEFIVSSTNQKYSSFNGVLFNKDQTTIIQYPFLKKGAYIVPNSVTNIGDYAFYGCTGITNITFSTMFSSIGSYAFYFCNALKEFIVPNNNQTFSTLSGVIFNKNQTTIIQCPAGKEGTYAVPNSVINIGDYAFGTCQFINTLIFPSSLTSVGICAFENCIGIKTIYSLNPNPPELYYPGCFDYPNLVTNIYVPTDAAVVAYKSSGYWYYFSDDIIKKGVPNALTDLLNNRIKVYSTPYGIKIEGVPVREKIIIYTINGKLIQSIEADNTSIIIPSRTLSKGMYLVKISGIIYKVIL